MKRLYFLFYGKLFEIRLLNCRCQLFFEWSLLPSLMILDVFSAQRVWFQTAVWIFWSSGFWSSSFNFLDLVTFFFCLLACTAICILYCKWCEAPLRFCVENLQRESVFFSGQLDTQILILFWGLNIDALHIFKLIQKSERLEFFHNHDLVVTIDFYVQ